MTPCRPRGKRRTDRERAAALGYDRRRRWLIAEPQWTIPSMDPSRGKGGQTFRATQSRDDPFASRAAAPLGGPSVPGKRKGFSQVTEDKDFKKVVRDRAAKTGESYSTARANLVHGDSREVAMVVVREQLASSFEYYWAGFRPQLRGLTTEEYRWEPVPGCPNIRPQPDRTWTVDHQFPVAGAASIAQRLCWAGQLLLGRTNQHFGDKSLMPADLSAVPGDATRGVEYVDEAVTRWQAALAQCEPGFLLVHSDNRWPGAIDRQFPVMGVAVFMFQLLVECCSQVSATRELYLREHPEIVGPR